MGLSLGSLDLSEEVFRILNANVARVSFLEPGFLSMDECDNLRSPFLFNGFNDSFAF